MAGVLLAAIHNGELSRSPAQVVVDELREDEVVDQVIEVTEQPPLSTQPDRAALRDWRRRQRLLEQRWRTHLGQSARLVRSGAGAAAFAIRTRLSPSFVADAWRARQIEAFVTAKHLAAWRAFVAGDADLLLVIESDAVIGSRSTDTIDDVIGRSGARPLYANLAGGLSWSEIGIDHLVVERDEFLVRFSTPVTNTSCAYMLNRMFAMDLLAFVDADPQIASLGVDWVINAFMLSAQDRGILIDCWHADPPALGHGSLTGVTRSWHPDR